METVKSITENVFNMDKFKIKNTKEALVELEFGFNQMQDAITEALKAKQEVLEFLEDDDREAERLKDFLEWAGLEEIFKQWCENDYKHPDEQEELDFEQMYEEENSVSIVPQKNTMISKKDIEAGNEFSIKNQTSFDTEFIKSIKNQKVNSIIICETSILYANVRTNTVGYAFPIVSIDDFGFWVEVEAGYLTNHTPSASYYLDFSNLEKTTNL